MNVYKATLLSVTLLLHVGFVSDAEARTSKGNADKPCQTWLSFVENKKDNVLLDFSYAGYKHGEIGVPDVKTLNYKTFNVEDFGAIANDDISDRQAFIKAVAAAKKHGNGIVYFPKGRFILHDATDDVNGKSFSIDINMSHLVIKGAGREKTTIFMKTPNYPTDYEKPWTSPPMINIRHKSAPSKLTDVTADAKKGSFSVEVASTKGIKKEDWICLYLKNNDPELVAKEVAPYQILETMTNLTEGGVLVADYHQVTQVDRNRVTFKEPIMYPVEHKWGWTIRKYPNYTHVGVEDLTFEGDCLDNFKHHGGRDDKGNAWNHDGGFKPLTFMRLTHSWIRRVDFLHISEALSIVNSANVSAYDIRIMGRRGHSAIRSAGSSRVFMGKISDNTSGRLHNGRGNAVGAGQWHGCGVSKTSLGAVLWDLTWGSDACFEAHATQPRATLLDKCYGNFMSGRAGGAQSQLPNHLGDLTMWNFRATKSMGANFEWWHSSKRAWWKCMPPILVGFHGAPTTFVKDQVKHEESTGKKVYPESLYEAQLERRLGRLPEWLNALQKINH